MQFDPYLAWFDLPPDERPPRPWRLLALAPNAADPEQIRVAVETALQRATVAAGGMHAAELEEVCVAIRRAGRTMLGAALTAPSHGGETPLQAPSQPRTGLTVETPLAAPSPDQHPPPSLPAPESSPRQSRLRLPDTPTITTSETSSRTASPAQDAREEQRLGLKPPLPGHVADAPAPQGPLPQGPLPLGPPESQPQSLSELRTHRDLLADPPPAKPIPLPSEPTYLANADPWLVVIVSISILVIGATLMAVLIWLSR